jgi:hypothetical protein
MKTNDFVLQKRKLKLIIKVETENIFYPVIKFFKKSRLMANDKDGFIEESSWFDIGEEYSSVGGYVESSYHPCLS